MLPQMPRRSRSHTKEDYTTVSFALPNSVYEQLVARLPNYGDRSGFFRTVVRMYLNQEIKISREIQY